MEAHTFLIQLALILILARILGEVANSIKIPAVIGELCAGILIGPSLLGWIELTPAISLLAQIGIILLLFEVGIETDLGRLTSSGVKSIAVATVGVIAPFALGFGLCYAIFHLSLLISLFIGCTLTATSIGITLRVLRDLQRQNSDEAQIILGAAVLDDIIGIILLSMLFEFSNSGEISLWNIGKVTALIALFFTTAPMGAKLVSTVVKKWDQKTKIPGILPTMIISLILFFAWIAHLLGAPELLGGFATGLALSRQFFFPFGAFLHESQEFSHKVEQQMRPIVHLFSPIFFVAIGLSLNLKQMDWHSTYLWTLGSGLILAAIFGKLLAGFVVSGKNWISKWIIGTAMIPRGEVGLIFANVGLTVEVLRSEIYTTLILVIGVTTLIAPFFLRHLFSRLESPR